MNKIHFISNIKGMFIPFDNIYYIEFNYYCQYKNILFKNGDNSFSANFIFEIKKS